MFPSQTSVEDVDQRGMRTYIGTLVIKTYQDPTKYRALYIREPVALRNDLTFPNMYLGAHPAYRFANHKLTYDVTEDISQLELL